MAANMRIRLNAPYALEILRGETRVPAGTQLRIRNRYSLISPGTELAMYTGTHIRIRENRTGVFPFFPGYAAIGRADTDGTLLFHTGRHESERLLQRDSGPVVPVPDTGDPRHYLFARFAQIADTAVRQTRGPAARVLVIGAGIIGNLAAQLYACKLKSDVIICDILDERLQVARACGINRTVNSAAVPLADGIAELTGGAGVDCIVEATGDARLISMAMDLVSMNGEVMLLGSPRERLSVDMYRSIHCRGISLTGAHECAPRGMPEPAVWQARLAEMMDLISRGDLQVAPFISASFAPENIQDAYEGLLHHRDRFLGVILDWN